MDLHEVNRERIPDWAVRRSDGSLELGSQLPTRDGRRMGNAHIIEMGNCQVTGNVIYIILTDAGNRITLTMEEVYGMFWPPMWVADVNEVIEKFSR